MTDARAAQVVAEVAVTDSVVTVRGAQVVAEVAVTDSVVTVRGAQVAVEVAIILDGYVPPPLSGSSGSLLLLGVGS